MVYQNQCPCCGYGNIYHEFSKDLKQSTEAEKELVELANMIYGEYEPPVSIVKKSSSLREKQQNVTVWICPQCKIHN